MLLNECVGNNTYETTGNMNKETYGFKSKHHRGVIKELFDIAGCLKFRNTTEDFQKQLKKDISSINSSPDVLIFAGKTNNIYKTTSEQYKKLFKDNVTWTYKKSSDLLA